MYNFPEYIFIYNYELDEINCYKLSKTYQDLRDSFEGANYSSLNKRESQDIFIRQYAIDDFCLSFEECLALRNNYYQKQLDGVIKEKEKLEKELKKNIKNPLME
jgi:transcription termination factor NusB